MPVDLGSQSGRPSGIREDQHYGTGVAFETLGFECAFTVEVDPEFPGPNLTWDVPPRRAAP